MKGKKWLTDLICTGLLTGFSVYVLLATFVIPQAKVTVTNQTAGETESNQTKVENTNANVTDTTYEDEYRKITITTKRVNNTSVYIADVVITDASYLKTAFADDTYGRNIKETTSDIAEDNNAILAINGDYYGFRDSGYVLRNGVSYRDTAAEDTEALVISKEGEMSIVEETETSLETLANEGAWQVLSFGPGLISDGEITVSDSQEVDQAMTSNPRTAIGEISPLHYCFVVSDGRTSESEGLSLKELAQVMKDLGCTTAYNLDGGGSSTMYFNGQVVNQPTSGHGSGERRVSDIVYI